MRSTSAGWSILFETGATIVKFDDNKPPDHNSLIQVAELRQIIDTIPAFVWGASPDGSIEFLNQRGLAYTGFSLEQLRGWNWKDSNILHPDDVQGLFDAWRAIVASGQEGEIQARMRRFDGEYKWFLFRVAPFLDHSGRLVAWFGVDAEIDERKRSEDELRRSQSYLAEAQKLSRTGSFGWKPISGELIWSTETFCILGYDPETKPTLYLALQRVHPDDLAFVKQTLDRASHDETDMDYEHRLLFPDGSVKYVHVIAHAMKDVSGNLEFVGAVSDVTAVKLAYEKIRQNEDELRRVVDFVPQIIFVIGPDGKALYGNRKALDYAGIRPDEFPFVGFGGRLSLQRMWRNIEQSGNSRSPAAFHSN